MTTHSFDVDEAIKYGMESAVLLSNIRFWLEKNRANELHCHDGYYWTYNSAPAFNKLFPYMSERSISRHLKNLCDAKVLLNGNYNAMGYDRKYWYTIPAEFAIEPSKDKDKPLEDSVSPLTLESLNLNISQIGGWTSQIGGWTSQIGGWTSQIGAPIANINTDINPDTKTTNNADFVIAVDNSLSEELQACWKWAKKQDFWRGKVYNQKAFLKHYNAESGALKGQYEVSLEFQKEEAKKTAAKKTSVKPLWQLQGFKSEQDYNAAHLQRLKQMEADMKGGKAANG